MKKSIFIPVLCLLAVSGGFLYGQDGWVLDRQKNGITVFQRSVPASGIKECKGEMEIENTNLSTLVAVLEDAPSYTEWMKNCIEAKILARKSPTVLITYIATRMPMGFQDRDVISYSEFKQDPATGAVTITMKSVPDYAPPVKGRVRMKDFKGYWRFEPRGNGMVKVVYNLFSDPGGNISSWMVNANVSKRPMDVLEGMRRMIKMEKYKNHIIPGIKEVR